MELQNQISKRKQKNNRSQVLPFVTFLGVLSDLFRGENVTSIWAIKRSLRLKKSLPRVEDMKLLPLQTLDSKLQTLDSKLQTLDSKLQTLDSKTKEQNHQNPWLIHDLIPYDPWDESGIFTDP